MEGTCIEGPRVGPVAAPAGLSAWKGSPLASSASSLRGLGLGQGREAPTGPGQRPHFCRRGRERRSEAWPLTRLLGSREAEGPAQAEDSQAAGPPPSASRNGPWRGGSPGTAEEASWRAPGKEGLRNHPSPGLCATGPPPSTGHCSPLVSGDEGASASPGRAGARLCEPTHWTLSPVPALPSPRRPQSYGPQCSAHPLPGDLVVGPRGSGQVLVQHQEEVTSHDLPPPLRPCVPSLRKTPSAATCSTKPPLWPLQTLLAGWSPASVRAECTSHQK